MQQDKLTEYVSAAVTAWNVYQSACEIANQKMLRWFSARATKSADAQRLGDLYSDACVLCATAQRIAQNFQQEAEHTLSGMDR